MAKQSSRQKQVVGRVMHEYKHGELDRGKGGKVKNPRQAIAVALSEAGASNQQSPQENRHRLKQTETKERQGKTAQAQKELGGHASSRHEPTRQELYHNAQQANIPGRSRMSKDELQHALSRHHA